MSSVAMPLSLKVAVTMSSLTGKIAVVTGASSGIGSAITLALAQQGMQVVGLARRIQPIDELSDDNLSLPGSIYSFPCDVSDIGSVQEAFTWIGHTFGHVHVMVNNAGRTKIGFTLDPDLDDEEIITTINTNLTGLVICTREAYKLMERHQDPAYIININSVQGQISANTIFSLGNVYGATKCGVKNHTEIIQMDLAAAGNKRIRVSSISPGLTKTNISEAAGADSDLIDYDQIPHLQPTDISDAVIYLLNTPSHVNVTEIVIKPTAEIF